MANKDYIPSIVQIPEQEQKEFDKLIKTYRKNFIRSSEEIVSKVFKENPSFIRRIKNKDVSSSISEIRELAWQEYLNDEVNFNVVLMKDLHQMLKTPKEIMDGLLNSDVSNLKGDSLLNKVRSICGEYAGRVFPYIYKTTLSTTNSRRSRAGKTFELIIYEVYNCLGYSYDSQSKVGRKIFSEVGLGKKVDSILPSIEHFEKRRNKAIIGTMKTSLRERWQEVAEEIERTKIPVIHLLTADRDISNSKAQEMSKHNIILVTYESVADSDSLTGMKNIISFEEYLFKEIPSILDYWKNNE